MANPSALALDLTTDAHRQTARTNIGEITIRDIGDLSAMEMARIDRLQPQLEPLIAKLANVTISDDEAQLLTALLVEFVGVVALMSEDARPRIGVLGQVILSRIRATFYLLWAESLARLGATEGASPSAGEKPALESSVSTEATQ